jgi:hypothetical protein
MRSSGRLLLQTALPLLAALVLLPGRSAVCQTFRVPLPELCGEYFPYQTTRETTVRFQHPHPLPDSLWVHWTGTLHNGSGLLDGVPAIWYGFISIVECDSGAAGAHAVSGSAEGGQFDLRAPFVPQNLSFLEDGQATFKAWLNTLLYVGEFWVLDTPTCTLDSVEIVGKDAVATEASSWGAVKRLYR